MNHNIILIEPTDTPATLLAKFIESGVGCFNEEQAKVVLDRFRAEELHIVLNGHKPFVLRATPVLPQLIIMEEDRKPINAIAKKRKW